MNHSHRFLPAGAAALLLTSPLLPGGGFQIGERSAAGLGRAFSGEAAIGDDATIIGSNPAGMILLQDDYEFSVGASAILPDGDVSGRSFLPGTLPAGIPASDTDIAPDVAVPYLYGAHRLTDNFSVGLGVLGRYGLKTDYSDAFANAAITDSSELITLTINPSVALRVNEKLTLGAGLDATYADATLTGTFEGFLGPGAVLRLEGDGWGFGFNLGVLYELSPATRFGLHYRSEVDIELEGSGVNPTELIVMTTAASADVTLPDSIEFSAYHELNSRWAVHGDVLWTDWSDFQELRATTSGGDLLLFNREEWKDAFRLAAGVTYKHNDKWTFRAGAAFDESPVPDGDRRTLRIPDGDRYWLSAGLTCRLNACYTVDVGYAHLFQDDATINEPGADNGTFVGVAEGGVDILSVGVNGSF
ncbi:MAG: long-chain fatty acid transporter [Akkermansiaceae bacterium]|nr:long-chain fatty acid transporter [Akkermansiaceae bacterium]NNM27947.1 long-chain fatty acid transporter [Akkermansiaceae bacterium]